MQHSLKLLLNTGASYLRILINAVVVLISTRIALGALGVSDFGLYSLLSGVVSLMSFVNGALMISSQRYFSICIGKDDVKELNKYFNSSLGIHILIAFAIGLTLLIVKPLLFEYVLNLGTTQYDIASIIYNIMIISSVVTVGSIPYSALMNAREDLAQLACIDIISVFIKLLAAVVLLYIDNNLLLTYSVIMVSAIIVKMISEWLWCRIKYIESKIRIKLLYNKTLFKEMLGFVWWNTLGSSAFLIRNQGTALILNYYFGVVANTAYGIANQINAFVLSFATTLTTVFAPSIIQAHGAGDDERMLRIAILSSKMSFLLTSVIAIPLLLFLDDILKIWLGNVPDHTYYFSFYIIISFLILQLTPGINRAIYAVGKIKQFQIWNFIDLGMLIPVGILLFEFGFNSESIFILMCVLQICLMFHTVYYAYKYCNLNFEQFMVRSIFIPCAIFIAILFVGKILLLINNKDEYNLINIIIISIPLVLFYLIVFYLFSLEKEEKKIFEKTFIVLKKKGFKVKKNF